MNNDYNRIRLTSAGTKVFSRQESGKNLAPQFRVLGEGLPVVLPFVDPLSIIGGDTIVLKTLLGSYYPLCSDFEEPFKSVVGALGMINYIFAKKNNNNRTDWVSIGKSYRSILYQ